MVEAQNELLGFLGSSLFEVESNIEVTFEWLSMMDSMVSKPKDAAKLSDFVVLVLEYIDDDELNSSKKSVLLAGSRSKADRVDFEEEELYFGAVS